MGFNTEFSITNNTNNRIFLNFNSYKADSNQLANFTIGTIEPYSSTNISFSDGIFYSNGEELKKNIIIPTNKTLYGNLILSTISNDNNQLFGHDNIRWFDLKSIVISGIDVDITDKLDLDPIKGFHWTRKDTIISLAVIGSIAAIGLAYLSVYALALLAPEAFIAGLTYLLEIAGYSLEQLAVEGGTQYSIVQGEVYVIYVFFLAK